MMMMMMMMHYHLVDNLNKQVLNIEIKKKQIKCKAK